MTDVRMPGGERDDPLLRVVAEYWDEIQGLADQQQRERLLGLVSGTAEPDPAEARAALADELLDLLPPDHPVIRVLRAGVMYSRPAATDTAVRDFALAPAAGSVMVAAGDLGIVPVTIYLADEQIHTQVEEAVEALLAAAGLRIEDQDDPITGSWFRRMTAVAKEGLQSPAGREAAQVAMHVADSRLVLAQDAEVTARLLQNLGPVLGALQPTKDAAIRVGALLIVKVDWVITVIQLTAAQQVRLDHHPQLASSPREIVAVLNSGPDDRPAEDGGRAGEIDPPPRRPAAGA